jgi:hypothetical protein
MCLQKSIRIFLFLTVLAVFGGCGVLDSVLPSTGTYKINAKINDISLDDFSIVTSKDKIQPFFEEPVSEDPDITGLVVFLKDSRGLTTGYKVTYSLTYYDKDNDKEDETESQPGQDNTKKDNSKTEKQDEKKKDKDEVTLASADKNKEDNEENNKEDNNETLDENIDDLENIEHIKKNNEIIFPVKSLDDTLPFLPLPSDLPVGKYTLVFQVIGKNTFLYKYEKSLFYLADAQLVFEGIQVHLPGIAENSQFIQNGNVILLDIKLDFDSRLDPYIVWYNGKRILDEGRYSDRAGILLWQAPEQNGFVSLRAEVFPSWERTDLTGYQKGISLLVSSKEVDMHLFSEDTPNLVQWYTFEGSLNDSLTKDSEKLVIEPAGKNKLNWMPLNGTYGLASGTDNAYKLPPIIFSNNDRENWQIISRFNPLSEGEIFSVQFGSASDTTMTLSSKKSNLILTLASASKTYSETLKLPDEKDSFITVSVKFFIQSGKLYAKLAFEDINNQNQPIINPISMEAAAIDKEFKIILGQQQKNSADKEQTAVVQKPAFTALWDELAIFHLQTVEVITTKPDKKEILSEETAAIEAELPVIIPPPPPPVTVQVY